MSNENGGANLPKQPSYLWLIAAIGSVVFLWCLAWWLIPHFFPEPINAGEFGDMFGAVNALFSGLAFAVLIFTIHLQKGELALQRRELELTRDEMSGQRVALERQSDTQQKQNFEDTFFRLLGIQNDLVGAIDLVDNVSGAQTKGRDCFKVFYGRFRSCYNKAAGNDAVRIASGYRQFFSDNQANVGHYFRNLYTLIKFIDGSHMPDKKLYTNMVRAQLSSFELTLLFYNCLSPYGQEKFKPLVEKYSLLKTVPNNELIDQHHLNLYDARAFV